jgi:deoxyribodipyrimidine photo-lyase
MTPAILWFRRNLRLADNDALIAASASGRPLLPVYVSDVQDGGGAARWWLHHSLDRLDASLRRYGGTLLIRSGPAERVLPELVAQTGATAVYYSKRYEPRSRSQEELVHAALQGRAEIHVSDDGLLTDPRRLQTRGGTPFRIFTPYWKAACTLGDPPSPRPAPATLRFATRGVESLPLSTLGLLPSQPDWAQGLRETWTPGENGALERLDAMESILPRYQSLRDRPDFDATSRLSPHLHFGEASARQVWHAARRLGVRAGSYAGAEALLRQLFWRDFSSYLLFHFPRLPDTPLRGEFAHFPWAEDASALRAWQQGRTGYPIVDAGMRQLWATGWMHNRVRMIAASFLVKHLLQPWQRGAEWFLDTLVDADLANNSASWQWVAGCGTDAAPYFRIFNPILQRSKFDPEGHYVSRWVREADGDYPEPLVDHADARRRALAAYQAFSGRRTSKQAPGPSPARSCSDPP